MKLLRHLGRLQDGMMQYILAFLAFGAVMVGVFGDPWDQELRRLTPLGWATIIIALAIALGSGFATYRDHKKIEWQSQQREKVREVAETELQEALCLILHPFESVFSNVYYKGERLDFDGERVSFDRGYLIEKLRGLAYREALSQINLRQEANVFPTLTWGQWFSHVANRADDMLAAVVGKYSVYLEAETLLQIHALQSDFFFRMRLKELPTLVEANQHMAEFSAATAFLRGPDESAEFLRFFEKIDVLAKGLPPKTCQRQ